MAEKTQRRRLAIIGLGAVGSALRDVTAEYHGVVGHDLRNPNNWARVLKSDVAFVCVGTPGKPNGRLDHRQVRSVLEDLHRDHYNGLVVIRSTLGLGAMARFRKGQPGLRLVYMPEFLRERSAREWIRRPDRIVVSGTVADCNEAVAVFYWVRRVPIRRMADESAELGKLIHNFFIAYKVSFANLVGLLAPEIGADAFDAMWVVQHDRRVKSPEHLRPTCVPFAGKCVPKDTQELAAAFPHARLLQEILRFNNELKAATEAIRRALQ